MGKIRVAEKTTDDTLAESEKQQNILTQARKKGKSKNRKFELGNVYISASYNNIAVSFADSNGNIIAWATSGSVGFKGPRKATPYAASKVVDMLKEKLARYDFGEVHIFVKGIGTGRDATIRSIVNAGFNITAIKDTTPIPHNGCRPKKPRRT